MSETSEEKPTEKAKSSSSDPFGSNPELQNKSVDGYEVIGDLSLLSRFQDLGVGGAIIAVGDNRIRNNFTETVENASVSLINAIHPSATIADNACIGKNVVIAAGVTICTHVTIEDSVICNTGCIVDHESVIKKACHICPGVKLAGHVTVEEKAFIGIGSTVIQGAKIGESAIVGAGAVVLQNVPDFSTVVGVPAKVVQTTHISNDKPQLLASTANLEPARSIKKPRRIKPIPVSITSP